MNIININRHHGRDKLRSVLIAIITVMLLTTSFTVNSYASETPQTDSDSPTFVLPESDLPADTVNKVLTITKSSSGTKKCLEVGNDSQAILTDAPKNAASLSQLFQIVSAGENVFAIRSVLSGMLLTVSDGEILWSGITTADDDTQRWAITSKSGGYVFTNAASGVRLAGSGKKLITKGKSSEITAAQVFKLEVTKIAFSGFKSFVTANGNVIALKTDSMNNGTAFVLKKSGKNTLGKQFLMSPISKSGRHLIKNSITFKSVDASGNAKEGAALIQKPTTEKKRQQYSFVPDGSGWLLIKNALGYYVSAKKDKAGAKLLLSADKSAALKVRVQNASYSSGNAKLDKEIAAIHKSIGSGGNKMRKSFNYLVSHYKHVNHANNYSGDWIPRYAQFTFEKRIGHCTNFAASLCLLFRSYGYDAHVVTGFIESRSRGWSPHGWVTVRSAGTPYIYDPDLYMQYHGQHGWYKRTYANAPVVYKIAKRWEN